MESMSATQSWKRWRLRSKETRFPTMGYESGHGFLVGGGGGERKKKMKKRHKHEKKKTAAALKSNITSFQNPGLQIFLYSSS